MKRFLSIIAAVFFASTAMAADLPARKSGTTSPGDLWDWSGFFVGVGAGGGWGSADAAIGPFGPTTITGNTSPSGGLLGIQATAQRQWGNLVFGVEGFLATADLNDKAGIGGVTLPAGVSITKEDKISALGTLQAKLGWAFEKFLPYGTIGMGCARAETTLSLSSPGPSGSVKSGSYDTCGLAYGAGLEYALTERLVIGVKYDHLDLKRAHPSFNVASGVGLSIPNNMDVDMVRGTVAVKF